MHVLLFEPNTVGHHLMMLRSLAEDLLSGDHVLSIAYDNRSSAAPKVAENIGHLLPRVKSLPLFDASGRALYRSPLEGAAATLTASDADVVFFPSFDLIASSLCRKAAFGLLPPPVLKGRIRGLFIRPRVADARERGGFNLWLKARGFRCLVRGGWTDSLFTLDETLPGSLRAGIPPALFSFLPDPWEGDFSPERDACRHKLGLPNDRFVLLHYGTASPRKGLPLIAEALANLPAEQRPLLVCAGKCGADSDAVIQQLKAEGSAQVFDRHIENAEEPLFFRASDAVALAYRGHYGSSGVLSRAAAARRWVIASDEGLVGHRVREANLGLTFESGNVQSLAAVLRRAPRLTADETARFTPGLASFADRFSREAFRASLLRGFVQASPLPTP